MKMNQEIPKKNLFMKSQRVASSRIRRVAMVRPRPCIYGHWMVRKRRWDRSTTLTLATANNLGNLYEMEEVEALY